MIRAALLCLLLAGCAGNPRAVSLDDQIAAGMAWFPLYQCADRTFSRHCPR